MSKSLGNSPDPIELIDQYGADSIRMGMMMCGRAGGDILFDESLCKQGSDFSNKLWNALRLIKRWQAQPSVVSRSVREQKASAYFYAQLQCFIQQGEAQYEQFRVSDVAISLYKFVREDFCNTYLELLKPTEGKGLAEDALEEVVRFFEQLLLLLHPFMPFLSEEIWQQLRERNEEESLMIEAYPKAKSYDSALIQESNYLRELLSAVRKAMNHYDGKRKHEFLLEAPRN